MYRTPKDLPQVAIRRENWSLADRIEVAAQNDSRLVQFSPLARFCAVAISMVEQPGEIYNGNCCGIMCQGESFPWGWHKDTWEKVKPVGYVLLKEGLTGKTAPFLAFETVLDSFYILCQKVERREIYSGEAYCTRWVGLSTPDKRTIQAFENACNKILEKAGWKR